MQSLITASIGLFSDDSNFYVQIISGDRYQFYYVKIDPVMAQNISNMEKLSIEYTEELPKGIIVNENNVKY